MSVKERRLEFEQAMHEVNMLVHRGEMPYIAAIEKLKEAFKKPDKPWWEIEKRYDRAWIKGPVTPELLRQECDSNFEKTYWHKLDISKIATTNTALIGPDVYKHLQDVGLLEYCPSIEALDFYEKNHELRKKYWDHTDHWVYAWRDAALSTRANQSIVVPGMLVYNKTGKVFRRWKSLQVIGDTKFKVLYRS